MKLTKAQKHIVNKLENKAQLIAVGKTWLAENVFFRNADDSYERSNVKVVRTLLSKNVLVEKPTAHFLVREYSLNLETIATVTE